jgi:hypothetical protein
MKTIPKYIIDRFGKGVESQKEIEKAYQEALFTAYKSLNQLPELKLILIDLFSKAGLNQELSDEDYTLAKLSNKEGKRELLMYLLQKLELTEIDFFNNLGG